MSWSALYADSWALPTPETYTSYDGSFRLTIYPMEFEETADFESEEPPPVAHACDATLEKLDPEGRAYKLLWRKPLINRVAPVSAVVSSKDGRFVTFDDWHHVGTSENTIVVYDKEGKVLRGYSLSDILEQEQIEKIDRSVSSIDWKKHATIRQSESILKVWITKKSREADWWEKDAYRVLSIDLLTGQVVGWDDA